MGQGQAVHRQGQGRVGVLAVGAHVAQVRVVAGKHTAQQACRLGGGKGQHVVTTLGVRKRDEAHGGTGRGLFVRNRVHFTDGGPRPR